MNPLPYQEAFRVLRHAGFVRTEIDRLYQFRRNYQTSALDQPSLNLNHLQFIRWLITTGRLTDQLPETEGKAAPRRNEYIERFRRIPFSRFAFASFRWKK